LRRLPPEVRGLLTEFRNTLLRRLKHNLVGVYLSGSVAFPRFQARAGDIDFYVVLKQHPNKDEKERLDCLHHVLARKFRFGDRLDGFYIPLTKARRRSKPTGLTYAANGGLYLGGKDDDWALHREHFRRGAYIALYGQRADRIFRKPTWREVEMELDGNLKYVERHLPEHPVYCVLQLCRLVYSFETRKVVISKIHAAERTLKEFPPHWRALIRAAIRAYHGVKRQDDRRLLSERAPGFFDYVSERIARARRLRQS